MVWAVSIVKLTWLRGAFSRQKEAIRIAEYRSQTMPSLPKNQLSSLVIQLRETYGINTFVETGTYYGDTAIWAARYFRKVYTVEASPKYYQISRQSLRQYANIDCRHGVSPGVLHEIIRELEGSACFWLDAHWSSGDTAGSGSECPVLGEIEAITSSVFEHFVLIDDARYFLSPAPPPHHADHWPSISAVIEALDRNHQCYIVVVNDVIVAVPLFAKADLAHFCQALNAEKKRPEEAQMVAEGKPSHTLLRAFRGKVQALLRRAG